MRSCTKVLVHICTRTVQYTGRHRHTQTRKNQHARRSICLYNFGSCSLSSSSAACRIVAMVRAHINILKLGFYSRPNPVLPKPWPSHYHRFFNLSQCLENPNSYTYTLARTPQQRSCRDPEQSSKAPLTHASTCSLKAAALAVRTDRSGSGTYQGSPI